MEASSETSNRKLKKKERVEAEGEGCQAPLSQDSKRKGMIQSIMGQGYVRVTKEK